MKVFLDIAIIVLIVASVAFILSCRSYKEPIDDDGDWDEDRMDRIGQNGNDAECYGNKE